MTVAASLSVGNPTLGRRRLRARLKETREALGYTQDQVATAMEWSLSKLIRIEKGQVGISTTDLRALVGHYKITDVEQVDELLNLARTAKRKPWWAPYRDSLPSTAFESFIGLESEASAQACFQSVMVPGLLQTEAYARTILSDSAVLALTPEEIDVRVKVRRARQRAVLEGTDGPEFVAVVDEAALRRLAGGRSVMHEQLVHLLGLSAIPRVTIEVLPFSAGVYPLFGPFIILSYEDEADADIVYVEGLEEVVIDDPNKVRMYQDTFRRLRRKTLSPDDSLTLIKEVADELR